MIVHPSHPGEAAVVFHRGKPGLEEVGPERKDQPCLREVIGGHAVSPEGDARGFPEGCLGKTLVLSTDPSHLREKVIHEIGQGGAHFPSDEKVIVTPAKPLSQKLLCLAPTRWG